MRELKLNSPEKLKKKKLPCLPHLEYSSFRKIAMSHSTKSLPVLALKFYNYYIFQSNSESLNHW